METRLETCQHRSKEKYHYGPPCCSSKNFGYYCEIRNIHGVTDPICDVCSFYLKKEELEDNNQTENGF